MNLHLESWVQGPRVEESWQGKYPIRSDGWLEICHQSGSHITLPPGIVPSFFFSVMQLGWEMD